MKKMIRILQTAVAAGVLAAMLALPAWAQTKTVTSVTIRVGTDTQAGEELNENINYINDSLDVQEGTYAAVNSTKYSIHNVEWYSSTSKPMKIGEEPKMKIYLEAGWDDNYDYAFRGSYSSNNITVKGGTFVSAKRSGDELEVIVKLNGIKGQYLPPDNAYWRGSDYGNAAWSFDSENKSFSSGTYDVYLYRGSTAVKKLNDYQGTSYNFYPYMTKEGTYYFKIRTVPATDSEKKYGDESEWIESDEVYIGKEDVSDGSGQTDDNGMNSGTTQVGWILNNGSWYYRYPDGSYEKNAFSKINGKWYMFDASGKMLTGWQQNQYGYTYYLNEAGDMHTGWIQWGGKWYYMNPTQDTYEGSMCRGWINVNGNIYYMDQDGAMAEGWKQVDGNWYYFYPGVGNRAVNTYIDGFYVDGNGIWKK